MIYLLSAIKFFCYIFLFGICFTGNLVADSCDSCYMQSHPLCTKKCSRYPENKKELCIKSCLVTDCKNDCGYSSDSGAARGSTQDKSLIECDYCQRSAQKKCYETRCRGKGKTCLKHCVSSTCRNKCNFPTKAGSLLQSKESRQQKCHICKQQVEQPCKSSCGSGQGSISCSVACIERKCFDACLID